MLISTASRMLISTASRFSRALSLVSFMAVHLLGGIIKDPYGRTRPAASSEARALEAPLQDVWAPVATDVWTYQVMPKSVK
ncbi:conserved hypothetical protein [Mesorhizobium ventifaucium]|uniref:Secreted protein n=1 Tax=Mesorhizobium ventifaucium TaxID=666020 RepID=A0ABN8JGT9_9HYPH|nr:conserved hypothetical protein [Mesorhizobium ventifaucium]